MSFLDWQQTRIDTPECSNVIHFNNAGAALMPKCVESAIIHHLKLESEVGGYEAEDVAAEALHDTYQALADLIGATSATEIAFFENASRAWSLAFASLPLNKGDRVVASFAEYSSNYFCLLRAQQKIGIELEIVPNDSSGQIDLNEFEKRIKQKPAKVVCMTHVPTSSGLVSPVCEVGSLLKGMDSIYLVDAAQSLGQMVVDVNQIGCDLLVGTGRKYLRGPRGTAFLYVNERVIHQLEPIFPDLRSVDWVELGRTQWKKGARRFETWEGFVAGRLALGVAVRYCLRIGLESIEHRVVELGNRLRERLSAIPGVQVQDQGQKKCGIVTFSLNGIPATRVKTELRNIGMNVSVSSAHLARLDLERRGAPDVVRASVHYYNNEEEISRFSEAVNNLR